jgi:tagatose 1,6-diphosphate aldolase GatY/KbaY
VLAGFEALLDEHTRACTALGAFTCYDLEVAGAVLAAAAARDVGVVLLISRDAFAADGGDQLLCAVRAAAERSPARACVQLDHVADLDLIGAAFELGAGAVMADGSRLPFDENVALVREARRRADGFGGAVEAELGHVAGGEDVAVATAAGGLTDPQEAERFAGATGAACLAVSIGNVHGRYLGEPKLDWDRLDAVAGAVTVPLSLHGASGLPDSDLHRAVGAGARKINANTELRHAYLSATRDRLDDALEGLAVMDLHEAQADAVRRVVEHKLAAFSGASE